MLYHTNEYWTASKLSVTNINNEGVKWRYKQREQVTTVAVSGTVVWYIVFYTTTLYFDSKYNYCAVQQDVIITDKASF